MDRVGKKLPCGEYGIWDEIGLRCTTCFAIWGSIGCACSNELAAAKETEKHTAIPKSGGAKCIE